MTLARPPMRGAGRCAVIAALASCCLSLGGCGIVGDSSVSKEGAVELPPADDYPEPGLQGQVPLDQQLPQRTQSYRRGLRQVGGERMIEPNTQLPRGGNYQMAWLDDCAYVGMGDLARFALNNIVLEGPGPVLPSLPGLPASSNPPEEDYDPGPQPKGCGEDPCHPPNPPPDLPAVGLAILTTKNPREPDVVYTIQIPITPNSPSVGGPTPTPPSRARTATATANPWEALQTNEARRLILVGGSNELAIYQAVYNCKYPSRRSIADFGEGEFMVHGLRIAPDGMTAYATDANLKGEAGQPVLAALDLTNLRSTSILTSWAPEGADTAGVHDVEISADGKRAYVTYSEFPPAGPLSALTGPAATGVMILDISDVQARVANPQIRLVSRLDWEGYAHSVKRARIGGRDHLIVTEDVPLLGACPWGRARVIDIGDETAPKEVSAVTLAVNDPANCMTVEPDGAIYSSHAVSVDDPDDTRHAFFSWYASGLRVFDLGNPAQPVEVAYFNPAPRSDTLYRSWATPTGGAGWDATLSNVRYRPETGHVWVTSVANGFQILEFTKSMGPAP